MKHLNNMLNSVIKNTYTFHLLELVLKNAILHNNATQGQNVVMPNVNHTKNETKLLSVFL